MPIIEELQATVDKGWAEIKQGTFWSTAEESIAREDPTLFVVLMCQIFHYTKHNAINQAVAAFNTDHRKIGLLRFAFSHANEELGHENMVVGDLRSLDLIHDDQDLEKIPIFPSTRALIAYLYYIAFTEDLTARLGYSFWAEKSYHHFNDLLVKVKSKFSLDSKNMTFFDAHGVIDTKHSEEVFEQIKKWVITDQERKKCIEVAETSLYLTGCLLEQVAAAVRVKNT